jgi:hypothetical protein
MAYRAGLALLKQSAAAVATSREGQREISSCRSVGICARNSAKDYSVACLAKFIVDEGASGISESKCEHEI